MEREARLRELALERAQEIAPRPTIYERVTAYFMLFVPGLFGGYYLADSAIPVRVVASLLWFAGFIGTYWWVQTRARAHERAFEDELRKLSG